MFPHMPSLNINHLDEETQSEWIDGIVFFVLRAGWPSHTVSVQKIIGYSLRAAVFKPIFRGHCFSVQSVDRRETEIFQRTPYSFGYIYLCGTLCKSLICGVYGSIVFQFSKLDRNQKHLGPRCLESIRSASQKITQPPSDCNPVIEEMSRPAVRTLSLIFVISKNQLYSKKPDDTCFRRGFFPQNNGPI